MLAYIISVLCFTYVRAEKLAFVFELVRHGARGPFVQYEPFTQGLGQLTAQGERQRYLLGRYSRERYTEHYDLYDPEFVPG
jgi:hypothetical protein